MMFIIGDPVVHRRLNIKGTVIDSNQQWGWYIVEWEDGRVREYHSEMRPHEAKVRLDTSAFT